jgi:hypothetical protein
MSQIKVAARRTPTNIRIELTGDFDGYWAEVRSAKDLPARIYGELAGISEDDNNAIMKLASVMDRITVSHNFPDVTTGELAESMLDVAPDALAALSEGWSKKAFAVDPS